MTKRCGRGAVVGTSVLVFLLCTLGLHAQDQPPQPAAEKAQVPSSETARPDKVDKPADSARAPGEPETAEIVPPPTLKLPSAAPAARSHTAAPIVQEPSQGRPIFITPGENFYFVMRLAPEVSGDVGFALRHSLEPSIRVALKSTVPPSYLSDQYCHLVFTVPPQTQTGLYDIEVRTRSATHTAKHCVKIVDTFKTKFRIIHLSNMNIGDLTAPDFDELLPNEVNLLAPEFIIATGDYTEWARAKDDASSWGRVLKFFEKFNAPVFMLCGLHDHEASFTEYVANKPIGTIDYGNYHGLLLLDHPGNPIDQDYDQLQWVERDLKLNRDKRFNFLVSNSDELGLLDIWREAGNIQDFLKQNRVKMFIVGGSSDWDFSEFANKLKGLEDFHYVRTHQASTALRDRATGFSHYRVIEVDGDQVSYTYPNDISPEKLQHSIPTGRVRTFFDGPNDGTKSQVGATVQNALNQAFADAHLWLRVAKGPSGGAPNVSPGRLVSALDAGSYWACDVAFDLPDKSGVKVLASADAASIPPASPIDVQLDGPTEWSFAPRSTDFGLNYFSSDTTAKLKLTNNGKTAQTCYPVICVNGERLHPDRSACPRFPLQLEPGKSVEVPLVLNLRRVSPGKHALQVYFLEDPLSRLYRFDVTLETEQRRITGDVDDEG